MVSVCGDVVCGQACPFEFGEGHMAQVGRKGIGVQAVSRAAAEVAGSAAWLSRLRLALARLAAEL